MRLPLVCTLFAGSYRCFFNIPIHVNNAQAVPVAAYQPQSGISHSFTTRWKGKAPV